ncbi:hypothetical protein TIFTF001_026505 [Ficus carica]|uniref:Uncharacterized protein n=1 Tax=Ficus carica TaxID=3494 RepID=A0AA88IYT7_FICCA|nr:hypothetical protein TIFTF001_026505 [Ficus carica]
MRFSLSLLVDLRGPAPVTVGRSLQRQDWNQRRCEKLDCDGDENETRRWHEEPNRDGIENATGFQWRDERDRDGI